MDYLDILNGTGTQPYKGEYYAEMKAPIGIDQTPLASELEKPVLFFYAPVENVRSYQQVAPNMIDRRAEEVTIKTKSTALYGKELEGFVKLQDGNFYQITSVTVDLRGVPKLAAVYVPIPVGADFVVRLTKVDNPFKVYETENSPTYTEQSYSITVTKPASLRADSSNPTTIVYPFDATLGYGVTGTHTYAVTAKNATVRYSAHDEQFTVVLTEATGNVALTITEVT